MQQFWKPKENVIYDPTACLYNNHRSVNHYYYVPLVDKKVEAAGDAASQKSDESERGESKLKHQSVLQTKLTRLAIQIGYAGK